MKLLSFDEARDASIERAPFMVLVVGYWDLVRFTLQGAFILAAAIFALALIGSTTGVVHGPLPNLIFASFALGALLSPGVAAMLATRYYARRRARRQANSNATPSPPP